MKKNSFSYFAFYTKVHQPFTIVNILTFFLLLYTFSENLLFLKKLSYPGIFVKEGSNPEKNTPLTKKFVKLFFKKNFDLNFYF